MREVRETRAKITQQLIGKKDAFTLTLWKSFDVISLAGRACRKIGLLF
jgi:hypothetical protein